jgi:predicted dinucleotide-binding enzyme
MKIGIIGTGEVGSTRTRRLTRLRHTVSIANSRGPGSAAPAITSFTPPITGFGQTATSGPSRPTLADLAKETGAHAVTVTDAVKNVDLVVVALNTKNVPDLPKGLFRGVPSDVVVVDTSNYYPSFRDGRIAAIEEAGTESGWVSSVLGRPVVKVFNNITAHFLAEGGRPKGAKDRIALPVAGDDALAKSVVLALVDELGFDGVDAGSLDESWRQQPGTPVYCTNLDADGVRRTLRQADRAKAPEERERSLVRVREAAGRFDVARYGPPPTSPLRPVRLSKQRERADRHHLRRTHGWNGGSSLGQARARRADRKLARPRDAHRNR